MRRMLGCFNGIRVSLLVDWAKKNGPESVRQHHVIPGLTTNEEWLVTDSSARSPRPVA